MNASEIKFFIDDDPYFIENDKLVLKALNKLNTNDDAEGNTTLGLLFDSINDPILGDFGLIVSIQNWKWQMPPENGVIVKTYDAYTTTPGDNTKCLLLDNENLCDGVQFSLTKFSPPDSDTGRKDNALYLFGTATGESSGTFTVTNINTENLTISGTFDNIVFRRSQFFDEEAISFFPESITLKGEFTNIPYGLN